MIRTILAVTTLLCGSAALAAPADTEAARPYQLKIVLHIGKHKQLTSVPFRDRLEREIRDSMQAALGDLASVSITYNHPRLKAIGAEGLERALLSWKDQTDAKTHFLSIGKNDKGEFEVQARQFDGFTGMFGPAVSRAATTDRELVPRLAAMLLQHDFGVAGTITRLNGTDAEVALKGGGLGTPLDAWLKPGDVFAVAQFSPTESSRVPGALLQAVDSPKDGICHCRLYSRYPKQVVVGAEAAYRCLKLGTTEAHMRFRVVAAGKGTPVSGLSVRVHAAGQEAASGETLATKPDGTTDATQKPYRNMAVVQVFESVQPLTGEIPTEIINDSPIAIEVNPHTVNPIVIELYSERDRWIKQVYEESEIADSRVRDLNPDLQGRHLDRALAKTRGGLANLEKAINALTAQAAALRQKARDVLPKGQSLDLGDGESRLAELRGRVEEFRGVQKQLEKSIAEQNDPKHKEWELEAKRARLREAEAQFGDAINIYEKIVSQGADDPKLKARLEELKVQWQTKDDKHKKAREFIYQTWPNLSHAADIKASLAKARESFEICRSVGDLLTPQRLRKALLVQANKLQQELQPLRTDKEDERKIIELIKEVTEQLLKLDEDAKEFLAQSKPEGKT
jgi:hypothetical protein